MTLKQLENMVAGGESLTVEFKHKIHFPEKIAREIVAFANTKGGSLLIGVDDNKQIFGLKNIEEEVFSLQNLMKNHIKFSLDYTLEQIKINPKKEVLCVYIPEAKRKPNFVLENRKEKYGIAYVRVADKSVKASNEMIKILKADLHKKEVLFTYGENEKKVIKQITEEGHVTLKTCSAKQLWSEGMVSDLLVNMCVAGILSIHAAEEKEDLFTLKV